MKTERRLFSCLLVLLVFFVLFASFCFILHESSHDCTEEICPVCAMIAICRNSISGYALAFIFLVALFSLVYAFLSFNLERETVKTHTPVSRKDRLLN